VYVAITDSGRGLIDDSKEYLELDRCMRRCTGNSKRSSKSCPRRGRFLSRGVGGRSAGLDSLGDRPVGAKLMFPYVRSEDGSVTDTLIMSFRTSRVVYSKLSVNKLGHGYRVYVLLPANYLMYEAYRTGRGRASIKISVIEVSPILLFLSG